MKISLLIKLFMMLGLFGLFTADDGAGGGGDFDPDLDDDQDDGAGAGDDAGDGGAAGGDGGGAAGVDNKGAGAGADDSKLANMEAKLQKQQEFIDAQQNKEKVRVAIDGLKGQYDDFDETKVLNYLNELQKTDPEKAASLNNPLGWENIYLTQFQTKEPENDHPTLGRNVKPVNRKDDLQAKIDKGETLSLNEKAEYFA